jgi:hypothetical protein
MTKYFICILLLFVVKDSISQKRMLMLQKKNKNKNVYYKVGDDLTFYRENDSSKITGEILAIEDSAIVFKGYTVPLHEITALHIDQKTRWWLRYKAAQLLLIGGVGYLAIDALNNQEFSNETLVISGSAIGLGLLCKAFNRNRIKIRGNTKLRILKL